MSHLLFLLKCYLVLLLQVTHLLGNPASQIDRYLPKLRTSDTLMSETTNGAVEPVFALPIHPHSTGTLRLIHQHS